MVLGTEGFRRFSFPVRELTMVQGDCVAPDTSGISNLMTIDGFSNEPSGGLAVEVVHPTVGSSSLVW